MERKQRDTKEEEEEEEAVEEKDKVEVILKCKVID